MWRQSCSPAGPDFGGLGKGDWDSPHHCGEGLWCPLDLPLLLNWEHHFHDPDHLIRESSLGHLATSLPSGSAEGECNVEWPWEHLLLPEGPAKPGTPYRPALTIQLFNFCRISLIQSSCSWWESTLGANVNYPWYTCSATCRMASSVEPMRVCMERCSGAVSVAASACNLWQCLWCSSFLMETTLWSRLSYKNSSHSYMWVVVQPWCSLFNSLRKIWFHRVLSATQLEHSVHQANSFNCSPSMAKLP